MILINHQIAIFGSYNKGFDTLYSEMKSVCNIDNFVINATHDINNAPPEIPRLEIVLDEACRINCSRNRFDIFSSDFHKCMDILKKFSGPLGAYLGFYRFGLISTQFYKYDEVGCVDKISQALPVFKARAMTEFSLRFNCPEDILIDRVNYKFNNLQTIEYGLNANIEGFYFIHDVNTAKEESEKIPDKISDICALIIKCNEIFESKRIV